MQGPEGASWEPSLGFFHPRGGTWLKPPGSGEGRSRRRRLRAAHSSWGESMHQDVAPRDTLGQLEQQRGVRSSHVQQGLGMLRTPKRDAARAGKAVVQEEETPAVYLCPRGAGGQKRAGGDGTAWPCCHGSGEAVLGPGGGCWSHLCGGAVWGSLRATHFYRAAGLRAAGCAGCTGIQ